MKTFERMTDDGDLQVFERYSKTELSRQLKDALSCVTHDYDSDYTVAWRTVYGDAGYASYGMPYEGKRPAAKDITHLYIDHGGQCLGFYGHDIVKNETYGDYELVEK